MAPPIGNRVKTKGEIFSGYLQYPAKLFVKYTEADRKYHLLHDFSRAAIPPPPEIPPPLEYEAAVEEE